MSAEEGSLQKLVESGLQKGRFHERLFSPFAKAVKQYRLVSDGDRIYRFSQRACNEVAEYFLTELADKIDEALKESNVRLPNDFTLSLTGGGIAYMRGAKEFLFGAVEIPINVVCPKVLYMAKPEETSKMAVLNYALNRVEL